MSVSIWIIALAGMLLSGAVLLPLSAKVGLPRDGLLLILGFTSSELVTSLGYDTGLRWYQFKDIVFFGVLPLLVFNMALQIKPNALKSDLPAILLLSLPIRLFSALFIALVMYLSINHPAGFPLLVALLLGVILTAPDPSSLIEQLNLASRYPRVCLILCGESLLNDVLAIVLFSLLLSLILMVGKFPTLSGIALQLLWISVGGAILGFAFGRLSSLLLVAIKHDTSKTVYLIAVAYLSFIVAENFLGVSGVVTTSVFGLTLSRLCSERLEANIVNVFAEMLSICLFFLAGMTVTINLFADRWLAILLAIIAVVFARLIGAGALSMAMKSRSLSPQRLDSKEHFLMRVSGTPGAVALALALSLPLNVPGWYTVQAAVYGVVIVGIVIQTPLMAGILSRMEAST